MKLRINTDDVTYCETTMEKLRNKEGMKKKLPEIRVVDEERDLREKKIVEMQKELLSLYRERLEDIEEENRALRLGSYATYLEDIAEDLDDLWVEEEMRSLLPTQAEIRTTLPICNNGLEVVKRQKEEKYNEMNCVKEDFKVPEFSGEEINSLYNEEKQGEINDIVEVESYPVFLTHKEQDKVKPKLEGVAPTPVKYQKEIQNARFARSGIG